MDILRLLAGRTARRLGLAGLEAVLELPGDVLEVAHAAGADSLSPLSLLGPVVCRRECQSLYFGMSLSIWGIRQRTLPDLGRRVAARGALMLLDVKRSTSY